MQPATAPDPAPWRRVAADARAALLALWQRLPPRVWAIAGGVLALIVVVAVVLVVRGTQEARTPEDRVAVRAGAGPAPGDLPDVPLDALPATSTSEAVAFSQLDSASAQAQNAAVPVAAEKLGAAKPFAFAGTAADRARATECLALAGIAEAGGGDQDQRAVMQVILNRVRHPAFAKTVCGVVFEGSQRRTGCQFTFTCDGSLRRSYAAATMAAARRRAAEAIGGYVHKPVGNATHYHADYVYPWWSPKLDKVAQIGPHLFFKWRGFWGTPQALSARYRGAEPDPMALRQMANSIERPSITDTLVNESGEVVATVTGVAEPAAEGEAKPTSVGTPEAGGPAAHFILIKQTDDPAAILARARKLCPGDRYCQVMGWTDAGSVPTALPLSDEARANLRFSFLPAGREGSEAVFFDCGVWNVPALGRCLPKMRF